MKLYWALTLVLLSNPVSFAAGKDVPVRARIFAGSTQIEPKDVNTELAAQGLKEMKWFTQYGAEVLFPAARYLDLGLRYSKREIQRDELNSNLLTDYEARINQDAVLAVVRIPFLQTAIFWADAFAGFGGTNTTFKIKTATQDGKLERKAEDGWFANPISSYGGSLGVGYKKVYFVVEAGVESNKIEKFTRTGNINGNIDIIDLSGSYVTIGLMFNGTSLSK